MTCSYGLGFKGMVFLMVVIFSGFFCGSEVVESNSNFRNKYLDVIRKIDHLKKHAVKSIKSEDGDIIDCIDIYTQPAFDHPALKNHTIQMAPSYHPTVETTTTTTGKGKGSHRKEETHMTVLPQLWQRNGRCPKGTVPIRRIREKDLLKTSSIEAYGRKKHEIFHNGKGPNGKGNVQQANHSVAILLTVGYSYSGAKGDIKVWNPNVEADDEYSSSQVSLKNGPYYDFESIESGWAVNPSVYGDRQTRLYTYWTLDASKKTGCFDVTCPGFIQTSTEIALGAAISPFPVPGGLSSPLTIYIFKDIETNNWWVQYGEKINIGYWPNDLFKLLFYNAEAVEWGGEVFSSKIGGISPHTATAMGNGRFADPIDASSGTITRMRIRDNSMVLKFPEWVSTYTDEYYCYDAFYLKDYTPDPQFYYGGPGRDPWNPKCP